MRRLVPFLRALCIALLLPATVIAAAQTDHVPSRHDCCADAAPASHHAGTAVHQSEIPASEDYGDQSHGPQHFSCGLHACSWIEVPALVAGLPQGLSWALYSPAGIATPPSARAESLHRPPAALS